MSDAERSDLLSGTSGRLVIGAVAAYVVVVAYTAVTQDPLGDLVADVFFGIAAIAFGVALVWAEGLTPIVSTAAASLVGSGVASLGSALTEVPLFDLLSNVLLLVGLGLYLYHRSRSPRREQLKQYG